MRSKHIVTYWTYRKTEKSSVKKTKNKTKQKNIFPSLKHCITSLTQSLCKGAPMFDKKCCECTLIKHDEVPSRVSCSGQTMVFSPYSHDFLHTGAPPHPAGGFLIYFFSPHPSNVVHHLSQKYVFYCMYFSSLTTICQPPSEWTCDPTGREPTIQHTCTQGRKPV